MLKRVAQTLAEVARGGAANQVWALLETLLPTLWSASLAEQPDLLVTAAEVAGLADSPSMPEGLANFAARKGSSRQLIEASGSTHFSRPRNGNYQMAASVGHPHPSP